MMLRRVRRARRGELIVQRQVDGSSSSCRACRIRARQRCSVRRDVVEFDLVDADDPAEAQRTVRPPLGTRLDKDRGGQPVLSANASSASYWTRCQYQQGEPAVRCQPRREGGLAHARDHAREPEQADGGARIEQKLMIVERMRAGHQTRTRKRVISASRRSAASSSNRFQIDRLEQQEAKLAALLRGCSAALETGEGGGADDRSEPARTTSPRASAAPLGLRGARDLHGLHQPHLRE